MENVLCNTLTVLPDIVSHSAIASPAFKGIPSHVNANGLAAMLATSAASLALSVHLSTTATPTAEQS
jgi:hypothetical protein